MEILPLKAEMNILFEAVKTKNEELMNVWKNSEAWITLEQLISTDKNEQ